MSRDSHIQMTHSLPLSSNSSSSWQSNKRHKSIKTDLTTDRKIYAVDIVHYIHFIVIFTASLTAYLKQFLQPFVVRRSCSQCRRPPAAGNTSRPPFVSVLKLSKQSHRPLTSQCWRTRRVSDLRALNTTQQATFKSTVFLQH